MRDRGMGSDEIGVLLIFVAESALFEEAVEASSRKADGKMAPVIPA